MRSSDPRFVCDDHCGRLARWLRFVGFDCLYVPDIDDASLLKVAAGEDRTILTRDRELAGRTLARMVILLTSADPLEQLTEVVRTLGVVVRPEKIARWCSVCNAAVLPATPEEVAEEVPPYVKKTRTVYHRCPECRRIYWHGTHVDRMLERLRAMGLIGDVLE